MSERAIERSRERRFNAARVDGRALGRSGVGQEVCLKKWGESPTEPYGVFEPSQKEAVKWVGQEVCLKEWRESPTESYGVFRRERRECPPP